MSKDIKASVLAKIKREKIKMIPAWQFVLLHILMIVLIVASVVMGAMFFAAVYERLFGVDFEVWKTAGGGNLGGMLIAFPFVWAGLIALMILASKYLVKKTGKGYKYPTRIVIAAVLLASLGGGYAFWQMGAGDELEGFARKNISFYQKLRDEMEKNLTNPYFGMISGEVVYSDEWLLDIVDNFGDTWSVDVSMAKIKGPKDIPEVGDMVFIFGEEEAFGYFKATEVRLAPPGQDFLKKM